MGSMEVPSQSMKTVKVPTAHYEFGANFLDPKVCSYLLYVIMPLLGVQCAVLENQMTCIKNRHGDVSVPSQLNSCCLQS